ncbi:MAG: hypothetical protein ABIW84_03635 [Ilumatobacteraceae bacterium]
MAFVTFPKLPTIDLRTLELPTFDLPNLEMPKFDLPKFELPKFDLPKFDTAKAEEGINAVAKLAKDAAYATVGVFALIAQKAQDGLSRN